MFRILPNALLCLYVICLSSAAKSMHTTTLGSIPKLRKFRELRVFSDPVDIGFQRTFELVHALGEVHRFVEKDPKVQRIAKKDPIRLAQLFGNFLRAHEPPDDGYEALAERDRERDLVFAYLRRNSLQAYHKDHRVSLCDQVLDAFRPRLGGVNIFTIDQRFEASLF